jgi:hypothetical protein
MNATLASTAASDDAIAMIILTAPLAILAIFVAIGGFIRCNTLSRVVRHVVAFMDGYDEFDHESLDAAYTGLTPRSSSPASPSASSSASSSTSPSPAPLLNDDDPEVGGGRKPRWKKRKFVIAQ